MQTITEKINALTHDELKQLCIEQNQTALDLMQRIEQQKTQLLAAGKLAYACNVLLRGNSLVGLHTPFVEALTEYDYFNSKSI